ncbi:Oxygen tolerance [Albimonas donghaensis]|uniref:Oxygen tolerance n=1 Tax=Albimonas donghaensis TaxID=356660 RepID=A0A1H2QKE8_9RHOB|nr:BatD family protein [Albimonas donghaensis]SDW07693.1 Oxygen tolerance [Albimonas donghaensis]
MSLRASRLVVAAVLAASAVSGSAAAQGRSAEQIEANREAVARGADSAPAAAAETAPTRPILRLDLDAAEAVPGQPLTLRLTVLVPTFMPRPPDWPDFEAPNLLVRLPGRATSPVSERVGAETWSGVSRRWRIAPMIPGDIPVPAQEVRVTWSDPDGGEDLTADLPVDAVTFRGVVPEGAEGLDPFIAASGLRLERLVEPAGDAAGADPDAPGQGMAPGDSVTVTLTATVEGVSPIFLPTLAPPAAIPGLAAYPDPPQVSETDGRDGPGGARVERMSLVAEGGGAGELPAVTLRWFDLDAGEVREATVPAVPLSVDGPPARAAAAPRDWASLAVRGAAALAGLALLVGLARLAGPPLGRSLAARRAGRLASEAHAWAGLRRVVAARDHAALRPVLDLWAGRVAGADPRRDPAVSAALLQLGAARYGAAEGGAKGRAKGGAEEAEAAAWAALAAALPAARRQGRDGGGGDAAALPPLNPV